MYGKIGILLLAACAAVQAQAKVDSTQAARLGQDLTPLGAERAGNAAGTIPAWTGGVQAPAGYEPGMHHPDPFAGDSLLYRVDRNNLKEHENQLPEGMKALLERYRTTTCAYSRPAAALRYRSGSTMPLVSMPSVPS